MIIADVFWRRLKRLKQELLNLKQLKKANCASKYYISSTSSGTYYNTWRITYKAGSQPIISEVLSYQDTSLSAPVGNQQYIFSFSQTTNTITVLSTREVISIEGIS